jgi:hypothetical protein
LNDAPVVQRVTEASAMSPVEPSIVPSTTTTVIQATPSTHDVSTASEHPARSNLSSAEMDELARRLYSRIRLHLRNELRRDRERAGSLIDIRR